MSPAHWVSRIALWAVAGAAVGLVAGLLLRALGVVQNPFWLMSAGLVAGAALAAGQLGAPGERRPPDDEV